MPDPRGNVQWTGRGCMASFDGVETSQQISGHRVSAHPWDAAYPAGMRWDAPIATGPVVALLDGAAADWGARPALRYLGQDIGFTALRDAVDRLAAGLAGQGVGQGSVVAMLLPNTVWHPVCFLALMRLGAWAVMLSPLDAPREMTHKLADSGARTLLTADLPALLLTAARLLDAGALDQVWVGAEARWGGAPPPVLDARFSPLPDADPAGPWPVVSADDIAVIQYTGGTTGLPKGAMLTHGNLTAAVSMYMRWSDQENLVPGQQRVVGVLPLFHIYALTTVLLRHMRQGNQILLHARFDIDAVLRDIEERRATVFPGVPTMWVALLNHPGVEGRDFSSLRSCVSGGAPLPHGAAVRVERLLGQRLRNGWGMTETAPAGARLPVAEPMQPGLIGVPLPGVEMRIVSLDDPSQALPPDEVGEIAVRGPNVFRGYWNRPEDTRAAFRDGWFLTGDIGRMDRRGLFTLLDRRKRMIISGGFNVYPAAVENAVQEHPDVMECCAIGVPDCYRGEAAKVFVTLRPDAAPLTLDALRAFLADRLGRHEMPAALEIRTELPRTPAGKLLPAALEAEERARRAPIEGVS